MRLRNGGGDSAPSQALTPKPDLQEVLEHYGAIVPHSGKVKINCIFHDENDPSLSVDLEEQLFKCFACPAAGSAWDAIMLKEDCDFRSAVDYAAATEFTSAPDDRGGEELQSVLGRRRGGVPGGKGSSRGGKGGRSWARPW